MGRTFCLPMGGYTKEKIEEKVFEVTGIELTPGKPTVCLGNGELALSTVAMSVNSFCFVFPNLT